VNSYAFKIVSGTDKEYVDAFEAMRNEDELEYLKINISLIGDFKAGEVLRNYLKSGLEPAPPSLGFS
jgi:hypothetical protein